MKNEKIQTAIFAAGCFWGVQALFDNIKGVKSTRAGYIGGHTKNPSYREVCTDTTGHAEAVEVVFDPAVVSYEELLKVFWENHDPTTPNRQGPDRGSQYRSAVFYTSPEQKAQAEKMKATLQAAGKYKKAIVTEITPASEFYEAEEYHQKYFAKTGQSTCHI